MIFKKNIILLAALIFLIATWLRFYRLNEIFIFNFDDEYQATLAWSLVKDWHPIWIGVSASFTDFYLGPYFTYFTAVILFLSKGNPLPTAYMAALTGVITTALVFYIGWKFFNALTAVIASSLYAMLPLFIFYGQRYWNPMFNLWLILLMFISIILAEKSRWWWVFYAGVIGVLFNTHLAAAPLILVGIWEFFRLKSFKKVKLIITCIFVFLLFYWPLIVFDLNHNFSNMIAFFRSGQSGRSTTNIESKILSTTDSLGRFWYLNAGNSNSDELTFSCTSLSFPKDPGYEIDKFTNRTYGNIWLKIISVGILSWFAWFALKSKQRNVKLLFSFVGILLVSYIFYPGGSFEYYNLGVLCLFTIIVGLFISSLPLNYQKIALGLIVMIGILGINTVISVSNEFGLSHKKILIKEVMGIVGQESFSIDVKGLCHDYEGWRYLFKSYGRTPTQSFTDKNFAWIYPDEVSNNKPKFKVILIEDRIPYDKDIQNSRIIKAGGFAAQVIENNRD